jgi:hypothetical protein
VWWRCSNYDDKINCTVKIYQLHKLALALVQHIRNGYTQALEQVFCLSSGSKISIEVIPGIPFSKF